MGTKEIKEGLGELITKENPKLPEYLRDTILTCNVLNYVFYGVALGEISNNVVYQLSKLNKMFDMKFEYDEQEIKELGDYFGNIIRKMLEAAQNGKETPDNVPQ